VLGPSRGGTSLTARILELLGVYLGPEEELLGGDLRQIPHGDRPKARAANPDGFWEHYRMMRINERILHRFGGNWREPPALPAGWESSPLIATEREEARVLLEETFAGRDLWGWKDPRNSLTLPFWQQLVPRVSCVICLRNPLDVVASLRQREGIGDRQAFELWLIYIEAALINTAPASRVTISYEDYFDDWDAPVARLARLAGVAAPVKGTVAADRIAAAIKGRLRRHRTPAAAVFEDSRVPAEVASLYAGVTGAGAVNLAQEASRS
jgi:hypothetical protein